MATNAAPTLDVTQQHYIAALAKISALQSPASAKATPIFQRNKTVSKEQAIDEAASALSALWKGHGSTGNRR